MQTVKLTVDPDEANDLYRAYLRDKHYDTPLDAEIRRTYRALANGHTVIKALESIVKAGVFEDGTPKLSIVRADQQFCRLKRDFDGSFSLSAPGVPQYRRGAADMQFNFPAGSLPPQRDTTTQGYWREREAVVPIIPLPLRPRRALASYHILWEAEWSRIVPKDPFLLKRLGKADLWLVVAAWDLTEVERAALQSRVPLN